MDFDFKGFVALPWPIIRDILHELPRDYIDEAFVHAPELRELIIDEFFSISRYSFRESSTFDNWTQSINSSFSLDDVEEVTQFLEEDSDIVPKAAYVLVYDMKYLQDLFTRFRDHFRQIPELHLYIAQSANYIDNTFFDLLETFKNLRTLELQQPCFYDLVDQLSVFTRLEELETLSIMNHFIRDWSKFELPTKLKRLTTSPNISHTMKIPDGVEYIRSISWCNGKLDLVRTRLPSSLTSLSIEDNQEKSWTFSQLPRTLKELSVINGKLTKRHWQLRGAEELPPMLESLDLSGNSMSDAVLAIFGAHLPQGLRILSLAGNAFRGLYRLKPLPKSLKVLDLSRIPCLSFEDPTNEDGSYFCEFSDNLETLYLDSSCTQGSGNLVVRQSDKIKLPHKLSWLSLNGVPEMYLKLFIFPSSLTHLSLENMGITDLTEYEDDLMDDPHATELFAWRDLKSLDRLMLGSNNITGLEDWVPPPNVKFICLKKNSMARLSSKWPLFNKHCADRMKFLINVNFRKNKICKIDPGIWLPTKLESLILDYNKLTQFAFTYGIIHGALEVLHLENNPIQSIQALTDKPAKLRILNVQNTEKRRNDDDEDMDSDEDMEEEDWERVAALYRELRKIGLEPSGEEANSLEELHYLQQMDL